MKIGDKAWRTIWVAEDGATIEVIDQTRLPHEFEILRLATLEEAAQAIERMVVRGAPLIGATAAYGVGLAMRADASDAALEAALHRLGRTRPTAVNLHWALDQMAAALRPLAAADRTAAAYARAGAICDEDVEINASIGRHGLGILKDLAAKKGGGRLNILTHCNAGWLATVDWGTATAPIYMAHDAGMDVHVWVDETRPRNQGAALTAYELGNHGVPHTVIVDNAGGHLMQHGQVDICITGTDRTTGAGDVANKIGTYLKALAAKDNGVPFYVTLPSPTIDFTLSRRRQRNPDRRTQRAGSHPHDRPHAHRRHRDRPNHRPRLPRRQPRLRRHPRPPRHRPDHRSRRRPGDARRPGGDVPGTGGGGERLRRKRIEAPPSPRPPGASRQANHIPPPRRYSLSPWERARVRDDGAPSADRDI